MLELWRTALLGVGLDMSERLQSLWPAETATKFFLRARAKCSLALASSALITTAMFGVYLLRWSRLAAKNMRKCPLGAWGGGSLLMYCKSWLPSACGALSSNRCAHMHDSFARVLVE